MATTIQGGHVVATTSIAGGAAGPFTVPGVQSGDELLSVTHYTVNGGTDALATRADRTSEFSVTGADAVTNAGGTTSAGGFLVVTWRRRP